MQIRFRNSFTKHFGTKIPIGRIIDYALAAEEQGWKLDVIQHSDGISIDEDGITLHLCKFSDKEEQAPDINEFVLSANRVLNQIQEERQERRQKARTRVLKSQDSDDIFVLDGSGFCASRQDKVWVSGSLYSHLELSEFAVIRDVDKAQALIAEAKAAVEYKEGNNEKEKVD